MDPVTTTVLEHANCRFGCCSTWQAAHAELTQHDWIGLVMLASLICIGVFVAVRQEVSREAR